jgi:integrase
MKKAWFVYFSITNNVTGQTIQKQFRGGINYYHNREDRLREGRALRDYWKQKLKEGWSPWTFTPEPTEGDVTDIQQLDKMLWPQALDFGLKEKCISKATRKGYRCTVRFFKKAAAELRDGKNTIAELPIKKIKRQHILLLLKKVTKDRNWSNKAYNKHIGYLSAVLGTLLNWDIIEYNPANRIKHLPITETQKFIPFTAEEKREIHKFLYLKHYTYLVYLMVIYHTGIRPKEVLALKIQDVNLDTATIKIIPDAEEENSKTKKIRIVPINNHLMPFLREMCLDSYPTDFYVFGSPFEPGKGNKGYNHAGRGAMHPDYFKPSLVKIKRDTVTRLWKRLIMVALGINKHQYAMKHTGADDKILAGVELDALKTLYGHSSKFMTEKYAQKVKEIYRQQIIEKSPAF